MCGIEREKVILLKLKQEIGDSALHSLLFLI